MRTVIAMSLKTNTFKVKVNTFKVSVGSIRM